MPVTLLTHVPGLGCMEAQPWHWTHCAGRASFCSATQRLQPSSSPLIPLLSASSTQALRTNPSANMHPKAELQGSP